MKPLVWLRNLFFPPKCVSCGELLPPKVRDFCPACQETMPRWNGPETRIPFVRHWFVLWLYEGNVRQSLLRFKFGGKHIYSGAYARALARQLAREELDFDVLTWVPISIQRKWVRGYDQTWRIAKALGAWIGVRPVRALRKRRHNPPQSSMPNRAARFANIRNVFAPVHPERFAGKRVLLLDDILTTGATASECAKVLKAAGAKEVVFAAVAAARQQ